MSPPRLPRRPLVPALLPVLWIGSAHAAPPAANWNLTAGSEYGQDSSRGSLMSVDYGGSGTGSSLSAGLSGLHTDAANGTASSSGTAHAAYGSEGLRGGISFASTRDQDYRRSAQWMGTVEATLAGWKVDLNVSARHTRFDDFASATTGGIPNQMSVQSSCVLDDRGFGAGMQYSRGPWTLSASAAANHFDSADCSRNAIAGSVANAVTLRLAPADLSALSVRFTNQGRLRAGGAIGQSLALLRSQYTVGIEHIGDLMTVAADASRASSEFGSSTQDTYEVSGTLPVRQHIAVKVAAGTTITASVGAPYVGMYVLIDW